MNTLTPFSGLSVIIHLLIIGIAVIIKTAVKTSGVVLRAPIRLTTFWTKHRLLILPSLSIYIIVTVALWVSTSTTIAVRTGLREGALESNSVFIQNKYAYLQGARKSFFAWNDNIFNFQRDESSGHTAVNIDSTVFQSISTENSYAPILVELSADNLNILPKETFLPQYSLENIGETQTFLVRKPDSI